MIFRLICYYTGYDDDHSICNRDSQSDFDSEEEDSESNNENEDSDSEDTGNFFVKEG